MGLLNMSMTVTVFGTSDLVTQWESVAIVTSVGFFDVPLMR